MVYGAIVMMIETLITGPVQTNCYLVACEEMKHAMVIDPDLRDEPEQNGLLDLLTQNDLSLRYIVNTHHHSDHTGGNAMIKQATGAALLVHELDAVYLPEPWKWWQKMVQTDPRRPCPVCGRVGIYLEIFEEQGKAIVNCRVCGFRFEIFSSPPADRLLRDRDLIEVGKVGFTVIHSPGHSPGGISLYAGAENVVFTGDSLFRRSIGRTDMFDASSDAIIKSVKALMELPDDTVVYPGHGSRTTIGEEKRENPYLPK